MFPPWERAVRCTGSVTPGAAAFLAWCRAYMGIGRSGGIYNCRTMVGSSTISLHGEGRAIDWMLPTRKDGKPTSAALRAGMKLVELLRKYARQLGIQCIIYNRKIWSARSPDGRKYLGAHPHYDHVHVELTWAAARNLNLATFQKYLGTELIHEDGTPDAPVPAPTPPSEPLLRNGSKGAAVREVQQRLIAHGFSLPRFGADGHFGAETEGAVRAFQAARNIGVDGIVGPETRGELAKTPPAAPSRSAAVREIQTLLNAAGVREGRGRRLVVDGILGPRTAEALTKAIVRRGSRGSLVRFIQKRVHTDVDGIFGPKTQEAVRTFQRGRGLTPDGIVGIKTWRRLLLS